MIIQVTQLVQKMYVHVCVWREIHKKREKHGKILIGKYK